MCSPVSHSFESTDSRWIPDGSQRAKLVAPHLLQQGTHSALQHPHIPHPALLCMGRVGSLMENCSHLLFVFHKTAAGSRAFSALGKVGRGRTGDQGHAAPYSSGLPDPEPWGGRDAVSLALGIPAERNSRVLSSELLTQGRDGGVTAPVAGAQSCPQGDSGWERSRNAAASAMCGHSKGGNTLEVHVVVKKRAPGNAGGGGREGLQRDPGGTNAVPWAGGVPGPCLLFQPRSGGQRNARPTSNSGNRGREM